MIHASCNLRGLVIIFLQFYGKNCPGGVMVAAQDLKSCDFGHAGSNPALGTKKKNQPTNKKETPHGATDKRNVRG